MAVREAPALTAPPPQLALCSGLPAGQLPAPSSARSASNVSGESNLAHSAAAAHSKAPRPER